MFVLQHSASAWIGWILVGLTTISFALPVAANPSTNQPITLKLAHVPGEAPPDDVNTETLTVGSFVPGGFIETRMIDMLGEFLNERSPGYFEIQFKGGPETFPPFELFKFVQQGAVDMGNVPGSFFLSEMPLAQLLDLPTMPVWEWRQNGVHKWAERNFRKHGIKYLGQTEMGIQFHCYTKQKVEKPEDLEGLSIRSTPVYLPLLSHFGVNTVQLPPSEVYTGLDRGVLDGFCWPAAGMVVDQEWHKQVNYVIEPGFYQVELALIMDLDRWNRLSREHQYRLEDAVMILERQLHHFFGKRAVQDRKKMIADGLEVAEFTGEARKRWIEAAYSAYWKFHIDKASSEEIDEIHRLNRILQDAGMETYFPENYAP